jgi:hypothetical protein
VLKFKRKFRRLKVKRVISHNSPGTDQIPVELNKEWGRKIRYEKNKIIISIWNKGKLPEKWKESIILPVKEGDKTNCSNYRGISVLPSTHKSVSKILQSRLPRYAACVDFDVTRQLRIIYYAFVKYLRKNGNKTKQWNWPFIDFKKVYYSFRREILYNILNEFGISKKLVGLIKIYLTESYSRVRVGKNLSDISY